MHCRMHTCASHVSNDALRGQRGHLELELQVVGVTKSVLGNKQTSSVSAFYHWANSPIIPRFWDRFLLYNSSWRGTHYVNHTDLKLGGLLFLLSAHWDEMYASPYLALIFFFHVHFACICVTWTCMCASCSRKPEEDTWSSGTEVTGPLQEQQDLLPTKPTFLPQMCFLL